MAISEIKKRDGSVVKFEEEKIANAIFNSARSVGGKDAEEAKRLAAKVDEELQKHVEGIPTVEHVQDMVEKVLIEAGHAQTAKAYIVYRQKRAELRDQKMKVLDKDYLDEVDKKFDVKSAPDISLAPTQFAQAESVSAPSGNKGGLYSDNVQSLVFNDPRKKPAGNFVSNIPNYQLVQSPVELMLLGQLDLPGVDTQQDANKKSKMNSIFYNS